MKKRRGCINCGNTKRVMAVDNFGRPFEAHPCCRILTLAEIEKLQRGGEAQPKEVKRG